MKDYTIEEKEILLIGLEHYIDSLETTRSILHDTGNENGNTIAPALTKFEDTRAKLMFDITPIKEVENQGRHYRITCPICGVNERPGSPFWGEVNGHPICFRCMKKYAPEILEKNKDRSQWPDEYREKIESWEAEENKILDSPF